MVRHNLSSVHILRTAVRMARELSQVLDWETGNHLRRMARYSKLIAATLGKPRGFDDECVTAMASCRRDAEEAMDRFRDLEPLPVSEEVFPAN